MSRRRDATPGRPLSLLCGVTLAAFGAAAVAQPPIVNPGAPGAAPRSLAPAEAIALARTAYTRADVEFLRAMIPHHQQALDMAALAKDRTNRKEILDAAGRIDASQEDEIEFMEDWLEERNEPVEAPADHAAHAAASPTASATAAQTASPPADHAAHAAPAPAAHGGMRGMATPEQMAALAAASGVEFDRLFLTLMIRHHEGAVEMVEELTEQPGSAYEPALFEFTRDVTNEQNAEIKRMNVLLVGLSADARANLKAGFDDAGEAIANLVKVASLPKPAGFFDPANPANVSPRRLAALAGDGDNRRRRRNDGDDAAGGNNRNQRSPLLSFANTDMAFQGDVLVVGSYHGFNVYRLQGDEAPQLMASVVCPGGQGDVSLVGDLLIMSVEQTRGRVDCGLEGAPVDASPERFRGIRIFDLSDLTRPVQVGQVQTCRGSHTHSVVASDERRIIVYNSGTAGVREEEELTGCIGAVAGDTRTALFRVDIVEIPVADPSQARIVDSPTVFADFETGVIAGLWRGGDHGDDTQDTSQTNHCHDITVFPAANIAAGACSGNGIVFDISDPLQPKRIDSVVDKGFAYWHSATFNNDGTKVVFTDEWGGGSRPRCRAYDRTDWGADAVYDLVDGKLQYRSHFKMPAPQVEEENCVAHNGSIVPVPGRDIMVQSWYQGGLSVWDFTDSANPVEIAYFDRGPIDARELVLGGYWSSYWYGGRIYATEIARGLDVFALSPSEFLSENEIAAALLADQGRLFNPQQQFPVTWPAEPVVARAYVDQLRRGSEVPATLLDAISAALDEASQPDAQASGRGLPERLAGLARSVDSYYGDAVTQKRTRALAETLSGVAARLR